MLLQSPTVKLRPIEPSDLPLMYKLENDTNMWVSANTTQPLSRSTIERYIRATTGDIYKDGQLRLVIEAHQHSIGFIDLTDFSPRHLRAEVGIGILPEYRQQGLGSEALRLIEEYASQVLFIHQLYAYVDTDNEAGKSLFAKRGFCTVGNLDDWLKTTTSYRSIVIFQKIIEKNS